MFYVISAVEIFVSIYEENYYVSKYILYFNTISCSLLFQVIFSKHTFAYKIKLIYIVCMWVNKSFL